MSLLHKVFNKMDEEEIVNNLTQQIALIQRQLQEKETYLQQKQAYLSLKQMYSTGMSTEKGAHAKAVGAISDASSSVDSVIESCKCADENESLSKTACKTACDFDSDFVKDRNASKCAPDTKKGSSHSDQKIWFIKTPIKRRTIWVRIAFSH